VQSEILNAHPQTRLRVYAIWVSKLFGDARNRWDAAGLIDPRVVHLWDERDVSGDWLAANVDGYQGSDWDTYLLFGPRRHLDQRTHAAAQLRKHGRRTNRPAQPSAQPTPRHRSPLSHHNTSGDGP
jgi:hypothetical protein